ncbi:MAG: hypothetical protein J6C26_02100 [Clostridia bacterium]|nr:hypothetical protein [Clostridia bacterium]
MTKRVFALVLAILTAVSIAACSAEAPSTDGTQSAQGSSETVITSTQTDGTDKTDTKTDSATSSETDPVGSEGSSGTSVSTSEATQSDKTETSSDKTDISSDKTDTSSDKNTDRIDQTIVSTDSSDTDKVTNTSSGTTDKPTTTTSSKPTTTTSTTTTSTNTSSGDETQDEETPEEYKPFKEITPDEYYGKNWLKKQANGDALVAAYESIAKAAYDMEKSAAFNKSITEEQLKTVWACYRNDYPQHFWLDSGFSYTSVGSEIRSLTFGYTMSKDQKTTAEAQLNAAVEQFLQGLHGGMNQFKLEKAIHDRLVLSCTYTKNATHIHDAYGALVEKKAVCEGYARAFQLLCRKVGIHALIAEGSALNPATNTPVGHAWNVVQINGDYYHLDSTWDDAGEPAQEEAIHYAWFNVTTAQILEDHAIQLHGYELPLCTSEKENYFRKTGKYLETLTVDGIRSQLKEKNGVYYAHIFIKNQTNAANWISQNITAIISGLIRGGCSYSVQTTGHGLYLVITPST